MHNLVYSAINEKMRYKMEAHKNILTEPIIDMQNVSI